MAVMINRNSNLILGNAYEGARIGAASGAIVGTSIVSLGVFLAVTTGLLEKGSRAIGNEPKWAFTEDCHLQQFRDLSACTSPPIFDSFTSFTVYTVGTATLCGMLIGAVSGAAKSVFAK